MIFELFKDIKIGFKPIFGHCWVWKHLFKLFKAYF